MDRFADIQLDSDLTVIGSGHFFRVGEEQFGVRGLIAPLAGMRLWTILGSPV